MLQSFQDDLTNTESRRRQSRLAGFNRCCQPDELVTVTNWSRGDGFANRNVSFLVRSRMG